MNTFSSVSATTLNGAKKVAAILLVLAQFALLQSSKGTIVRLRLAMLPLKHDRRGTELTPLWRRPILRRHDVAVKPFRIDKQQPRFLPALRPGW